MTDRTRLDYATEDERFVLLKALAARCPQCGAEAGFWCYRVNGEWTLHAGRLLT